MERIEWDIKSEAVIEVKLNGMEEDVYTTKKFTIRPKELLTFQRAFGIMMFDYCNKFNCKFDEPACK